MIRAAVKRLVRSVYVMRCGYCGVSDSETGAELTYDHFQPASKGGADSAENLVYACHACNEHKSDYWGETEADRLLHPLSDDSTAHLQYNPAGEAIPLTTLGERYIRVLHLNRPPLIAYRQARNRENNAYRETLVVSEKLDRILARLATPPVHRRRRAPPA